MNRKITATKHPIDFNNLSPKDFSRLCFWLVEASGEYENVEFYDGPGDKQRDVIGYINDGSNHYYQCKRYKEVNFSHIKKELEEIGKHVETGAIQPPKRIYFVSSTEVPPRTKDKVRILCKKLGLPEIAFWGSVILDKKIKARPEALANFFDIGAENNHQAPIVDVEGLVDYSTNGYSFCAVNNGTSKAIDIKWKLLGFNFSYSGTPTVFSLSPGELKDLRIDLTGDFMKKNPIKELRFRFQYRDGQNNKYYSERALDIEEVNSGAFYRIAGEPATFTPPQELIDFEIENIENLPRKGARYGYAIDYTFNGNSRTLELYISNTLIAIFGFNKDQVKAAVRELASEKIRKMIKSDVFQDKSDINSYMLEEPSLHGFDAYIHIRSKI